MEFSLNHRANVPDVIDLAQETRRRAPDRVGVPGGHSGSLIARAVLPKRIPVDTFYGELLVHLPEGPRRKNATPGAG